MSKRQRFAYLFFLIAIVVAPTVLALGWYQISRDPNLRPLGVTRQALRAFGGEGEAADVVAVIDWAPQRAGNYSKEKLSQSLVDAFLAKGVEVEVRFRDGAARTRITYLVGKSRLGPFSTARASEGIAAAVEAYKMY